MKHKAASIAVVAVLAVGGSATACGGDGGGGGNSTPSKAPPSSTPQTPKQSQTPTSSTPRLAVGQTLHISTSPAELARPIPAGAADVTLLEVRVSKDFGVQKAEPGTQVVIWKFKVTNTGPDEFDLYPLTVASRWTSNAQVAAPGVFLGDVGDFLQPDPRPGESVTGSAAAVVPDQDGVLEFADRSGNPLFEIAVTR
ncbi:hypothetical protein OG905_36295 [Streptomyces sp. NBC_00322]|uniref:hypothetical protein n=1 Tax=Streptomyces sp. NBC_00322 TaxID=2975712 RepID=UPI002E2DCB66|nr:hypothetical protein [Streptomyces sp. NBC_00322]